jgi:hypothetical protein
VKSLTLKQLVNWRYRLGIGQETYFGARAIGHMQALSAKNLRERGLEHLLPLSDEGAYGQYFGLVVIEHKSN